MNAQTAGLGEGEAKAARDLAPAEHEFSVKSCSTGQVSAGFPGHRTPRGSGIRCRFLPSEESTETPASSTNPATEWTHRRNERDPVAVRSRVLRPERRNPGLFGGLSFRLGALPQMMGAVDAFGMQH